MLTLVQGIVSYRAQELVERAFKSQGQQLLTLPCLWASKASVKGAPVRPSGTACRMEKKKIALAAQKPQNPKP